MFIPLFFFSSSLTLFFLSRMQTEWWGASVCLFCCLYFYFLLLGQKKSTSSARFPCIPGGTHDLWITAVEVCWRKLLCTWSAVFCLGLKAVLLLSPYSLLWFHVLDTERLFCSVVHFYACFASRCLWLHRSLWLAGTVAGVPDVAWETQPDWPGSGSLFLLSRHLIWSFLIW